MFYSALYPINALHFIYSIILSLFNNFQQIMSKYEAKLSDIH